MRLICDQFYCANFIHQLNSMQLKKALLFLAFISSAATCAYAQALIPTMTAVTNTPATGDRFLVHYADTTGITMGLSGANVLWDYSLLLTNAMDTLSYVACNSTTMCDSFPGSTIVAVTNSNTTYNYLSANMSGIKSLGSYETEAIALNHYTDPMNVVFFPFSYTSHYRDTFTYMPSSGATDSFVCDGYGTLMLPNAVYTNALRVHITTVYRDTVIVASIPVINEYQTEEYRWFDSGYHNELLSIAYDTAGTSVPYITNIKYYSVIPRLAVNNIVNSQVHFDAYPNPATDMMSVKFDIADKTGAFITVTDMVGKTVCSIANDRIHTGTNLLELPVNNLPQGAYAIQLHTNSGNAVKKMIISK